MHQVEDPTEATKTELSKPQVAIGVDGSTFVIRTVDNVDTALPIADHGFQSEGSVLGSQIMSQSCLETIRVKVL